MRYPGVFLCAVVAVGCGDAPDSASETAQAPDTLRMFVDLAITPGLHAAADSFGLISSVAVDQNGYIYATDRQGATVWTFGPGGEHLGRIGKQGEGPGEFDAPTGLGIDPEGRLVVRDVYRITRFSANASGLLNTQPETFEGPTYAHWTSLRSSRFDTAGVLFYPGYEFSEDGEVRPFAIRYSSAGEVLDTLHLPPEETTTPRIPFVRLRGGDGRLLRGLEHVPFAALPVWDVTPEGTVISGSGAEYHLRETDATGKAIQVFERVVLAERIPPQERSDSLVALRERLDSVPVPLDDVERLTDAVRQLQLPTTYPLYAAVYVGSEGKVWVRRWIPVGLSRTIFDVFDRDGTFRVSVVLPETVLVEPTPVLSLSGIVAVVRDPLTDEDGLLRFVPEG